MEPAARPVNYVIPTRPAKIEEQFITVAVAKDGTIDRRSIGWFILFEGSREWLHLGPDKPELSPGEEVEIVIRRPLK